MTTRDPSATPASRRRFWSTVVAFATANALAWLACVAWLGSHRDLLRVEEFSPGDGVEIIGRRPVLAWRFNLPMADDPAAFAEHPPVTCAPALVGAWAWKDDRTLTFTPRDELPLATAFTLAIAPGRLRSRDGFALGAAFTATIHTMPLRLFNVRQVASEPGERYVLALDFSDRVLSAELLRHLAVVDADKRPVAVDLHGDANGTEVRLITESLAGRRLTPAGTKLVISVTPGLAGTGGPLPLTTYAERMLDVGSGLHLTAVRADNAGRGKAELNLQFSNPVATDVLRQVLRIEPAVAFTFTHHWDGVGLEGDFVAGQRYAVVMAPPPAGAKPGDFPQPDTVPVVVPDRMPSLWFDHGEGYLGAAGNRALMLHAINFTKVRIAVTRVYDSNLVAWRNASRSWYNSSDNYSRPIASRTIAVAAAKNRIQDLRLSLDELLPAEARGDGAYRIDVAAAPEDATAGWYGENYYRYGGSANATVTLSDIALSAHSGRDGLVVWAVSLSTARPLANVRVRLYSNKSQPLGEALTDAQGLARIAAAAPAKGEEAALLLADRPAAGDGAAGGLTWLDLRHARLGDSGAEIGGRAFLRDGYEAFVYADRGVYRPGEAAHLRAIVRGPDGAAPAAFPLRWQLRRPDLKDWRGEVRTLDGDGASSLDLALPDDLPTGHWTALVGLPGDGKEVEARWFGSLGFQVEEFMPDQLKAELSFTGAGLAAAAPNAAARFRTAAGPLTVQVQGDYLFGQPAAGREASLAVRLEPGVFSHGDWKGWTFADAADSSYALGVPRPEGQRLTPKLAALDAHGRSTASVDLAAELRGAPAGFTGPWLLTAAGSVSDVGGRSVSASRGLTVDAADRYLGLHPQQDGAAKPGQPWTVACALVDPTGKLVPAAAAITARLYREHWNTVMVSDNGGYRYVSRRELEAVGEAQNVALASGRGEFAVTPPAGGAYVVRLSDPGTGQIVSRQFYAADNGSWDDTIDRNRPEHLELRVFPGGSPLAAAALAAIATKNSEAAPTGKTEAPVLAAGGEALVLVRSPFPGRLLLTVATDAVVQTTVIELDKSQALIPLAVGADWLPNAYITGTVVRAVDAGRAGQVHRAFGIAPVRIDQSPLRLAVEIAAPAESRPNRALPVTLSLRDAAGAPVADAAVTVAAVDEGILRLTTHKTPDPFAFFTAKRSLAVATSDSWRLLLPEVPRPGGESPVGGDGGDEDAYDPRRRSPIAAKRVRPVALWSGVVRSDAAGTVSLSLALPNFNGELRLMAVASAGARFGAAERALLVRSPLVVQAALPRFAAPGDRFTAPVVIFNRGATAGTATVRAVVADASAALLSVAAPPAPLAVAANGEAVAALPFTVGAGAGVAKLAIEVDLGDEHFRDEIELPVRPASPAVTVGGDAVAEAGKPAVVALPAGFLVGSGETAVQVASAPALALPRGIEFLYRYPYGCAEQTVSAVFPLVYLADLGERIAPALFDRAAVAKRIAVGIDRLQSMQCADGGLAMWPAYRETWPWASVYAAHFLIEAKAAGQAVPDEFLARLLDYDLRLIDRHSDDDYAMAETQAYAGYVLARAGRAEATLLTRLEDRVRKSYDHVPTCRFLIAAAWLAAGRADKATAILPREIPVVRAGRQLGGALASPIRDHALLVSTLCDVQPNHPALPRLAQELADHGRDGHWSSTQDTACAVLALGKYLRLVKANGAPYVSAELWSGATKLAEARDGKPLTWSDAPADPSALLGPRATGPQLPNLELRVAGPANARAYLSWTATGVPLTPPVAGDHGLIARRSYLDDRGQPITGAMKTGQLVQVVLDVRSDLARGNVVLEDLLPAGLEVENPRFDTAAKAVQVAGHSDAPPYERLDVRDDRVVLFLNLPANGNVHHTYLARVLLPGTYTLPPVRAECMYDPSIASVADGGVIEVVGK